MVQQPTLKPVPHIRQVRSRFRDLDHSGKTGGICTNDLDDRGPGGTCVANDSRAHVRRYFRSIRYRSNPQETCPIDDADYTNTPTRQHDELDHTDHTDRTDHTDQESICPERSRSSTVETIYLICHRCVKTFHTWYVDVTHAKYVPGIMMKSKMTEWIVRKTVPGFREETDRAWRRFCPGGWRSGPLSLPLARVPPCKLLQFQVLSLYCI